MKADDYKKSLFSSDPIYDYRGKARLSALRIVPLVLEMVGPRSIIDVGCGVGIWLSVFKELGVQDIYGVDGDYVTADMLAISKDRFMPVNLEQPFTMDRKFDLVVSLEVAEHLPSSSASGFVDSLVRLGPVVLFSAAIPFQGGVRHVNEQWPDYWVERFQEKGFVVIDCLRHAVWQNEEVDWWYAQNLLVFVDNNHLKNVPSLVKELAHTRRSQLSMVHPRLYLHRMSQYKEPSQMALREALANLPSLFKRAVSRRLRPSHEL